MKKSIKVLICVLCLVFCLGLFAGCDGETGGAATATPAPTDSNGSTSGATSGATSSSDGQDPYLRPRDESLENAIKEGETYRYFIYTTNDPNNPFEADSENPNSSMEIGYILKKQNILSNIGETYIKELVKYLTPIAEQG